MRKYRLEVLDDHIPVEVFETYQHKMLKAIVNRLDPKNEKAYNASIIQIGDTHV